MCLTLKMPSENLTNSSGVQQQVQQESKSNEKSSSSSTSEAMVEETEASDEVKVYCHEEEEAEDERETEAKVSSLSSLSDDKSRLITESEQSKEPSRGHHDLALASKTCLVFPLVFERCNDYKTNTSTFFLLPNVKELMLLLSPH